MKLYQPASKNILTLCWITAFALLGTIVRTLLGEAGYPSFEYSYAQNPFVSALFPMIAAGVPITLIAGFIFGVFTLGREETRLGKWQAGTLVFIVLILGYLTSFWMVNGGVF